MEYLNQPRPFTSILIITCLPPVPWKNFLSFWEKSLICFASIVALLNLFSLTPFAITFCLSSHDWFWRGRIILCVIFLVYRFYFGADFSWWCALIVSFIRSDFVLYLSISIVSLFLRAVCAEKYCDRCRCWQSFTFWATEFQNHENRWIDGLLWLGQVHSILWILVWYLIHLVFCSSFLPCLLVWVAPGFKFINLFTVSSYQSALFQFRVGSQLFRMYEFLLHFYYY